MLNSIAHFVGLLVFFLMIFSAGANKGIRYAILFGLLCLLSIRSVTIKGRMPLRIAPVLLFFTLFYVILGLSFSIYGYIAGNLGAIAMIQAYVLYPIIFALILHFSSNERFLWNMAPIIVIAGIAASLYGLTYFGTSLGVLPDYLNSDIGVVTTLSTESGSVGMGLQTIIPVLFIIPFLIALIILRYSEGVKIVNIAIVTIALALCLVLAILTGRRSLWIVIAIAPFLTVIFCSFSVNGRRSFRKQIFIIVAVFFFIASSWFVFERFAINELDHDFNDRLLSIFNANSDSSIEHKENQAALMLSEWRENPIFGFGHGAVLQGITSSDEEPWAYEATYHLLLHNTGLIGFMAYSTGIVWLYLQAVKIIKRCDRWSYVMIATLVGLTSLLMANMTNPYLGQIDSLWMLYYPLAIINMVLLKADTKSNLERPIVLVNKNCNAQ